MARSHVEGLRTSDPGTLAVLVQDLVRLPLGRLDLRSVCDLVALAELEELTGPLRRDLQRFRDRILREMADLPDGSVLQEFLDGLAGIPAWRVPETVRQAVVERDNGGLGSSTALRVQELKAAWAAEAPRPPRPGTGRRIRVQQAADQEVEAGARSPGGVVRSGRRTTTERKGARRPRRAPVSRDPRREEWIREDVLDRLRNYRHNGLKESILVAGACHRSPFSDLTEAEVQAVLRRMEREGLVRRSQGRLRVR